MGVAPGMNAGEMESFAFNVPNEVVGIIIGRGGTTHRQLQENTGCQVVIPKESDPGCNYRSITLRGSRVSVSC